MIDDDAGQLERLELDAAVTVGVSAPPRGSAHCATLVAWATQAKRETRNEASDSIFTGVAPDASVRAYFIPKGTEDSLWVPLAIIRAVDDGADVVLCATNVDGQASPLLDDALTFARQLGRGGHGTAVVMPSARETSSPEGSVHASLSLGVGEPASDPRVFCVSPSGKNGNWFLWSDRRGRLRPFANRAPGARWMALGDDVPYPFGPTKRLAHAESSGASAMAAGALLLVLGVNPDLSLAEVDAILCRTVSPVPGDGGADWSLVADRCDPLPLGRDPDGHNAKHRYGRLDATAAC